MQLKHFGIIIDRSSRINLAGRQLYKGVENQILFAISQMTLLLKADVTQPPGH